MVLDVVVVDVVIVLICWRLRLWLVGHRAVVADILFLFLSLSRSNHFHNLCIKSFRFNDDDKHERMLCVRPSLVRLAALCMGVAKKKTFLGFNPTQYFSNICTDIKRRYVNVSHSFYSPAFWLLKLRFPAYWDLNVFLTIPNPFILHFTYMDMSIFMCGSMWDCLFSSWCMSVVVVALVVVDLKRKVWCSFGTNWGEDGR